MSTSPQIIGALLGLWQSEGDLGILGDSLLSWVRISPELLLVIFLPALIFGSALSVDYHTFAKELPQILTLAVPGVVISAGLTACFIKVLPIDFSWDSALALGSVLAATDPVAVVALLKELGASQRLSLLIEGESLFNDGTAFVLFVLFFERMQGVERAAGEAVGFCFQLSLGAVAFGVLTGWLTVRALSSMPFDIVAQTAITIFAAYGTFIVAEVTLLEVSSVLATVVMGLTLASQGHALVFEHDALHEFWEMVEYLANTVIFVLSGAVIVERGILEGGLQASDWGYLLLLYVALVIIRGLTVLLLSPVLKISGYGLQWSEMGVLTWGGLRGAVGLVLALLVEEDETLDDKLRARFLFLTAGIAALTLLVNGTTTGPLLRVLGLVQRGHAAEMMFITALHHIEHKTYTKKRHLRQDALFCGADWDAVTQYTTDIFDELYGELRIIQEQRKREANTVQQVGSFIQDAVLAPGARCSCRPPRCCQQLCGCCSEDQVTANRNTRRAYGLNSDEIRAAEQGIVREAGGVTQQEAAGGGGLAAGPSFTAAASVAHLDAQKRHESHRSAPAVAGQAAQNDGDETGSDAGSDGATSVTTASTVGSREGDQHMDDASSDSSSILHVPSATLLRRHRSEGGYAGPGMGAGSAPEADTALTIGPSGDKVRVLLREDLAPSRSEVLGEARFRFYALLKAEYQELFESGRVSRAALKQLSEAASGCQDHPSRPLCDFDQVQHLIHTNPLRTLASYVCICWPALQQYLQLDSMYLDFELVFGFVEGHRAVHRNLVTIVDNSIVAKKVVDESLSQVVAARKYLADLEDTLPELAGAVKSKHAIRALIYNATHEAQQLMKHGELDEKDFVVIRNKVQAAWRRAALQVKPPSPAALLKQIGYMSDLPDDVFDELYRNSRREVYHDGDVVFEQGTKLTAFWVVVRGHANIVRKMRVAVVPPGEGPPVPPAVQGDTMPTPAFADGSAKRGHVVLDGGGSATASPATSPPLKSGASPPPAPSSDAPAKRRRASAVQAQAIEMSTLARQFSRGLLSTKSENVLVERRVDAAGPGSVLGLLPVLTGGRAHVSARAQGPLVLVRFKVQDVFHLMQSSEPVPHEPGLRRPSHLEEVLCRMAATAIVEAVLAAQLSINLKASEVKAVLGRAQLLRPVGKAPVHIPHRAILLTGSELKPKTPKAATLAHELVMARAADAQERQGGVKSKGGKGGKRGKGFDEAYHSRHEEEDTLPELADDQFTVLSRAFSYLGAPDGKEARWFSHGARLLIIPDDCEHVFSDKNTNTRRAHYKRLWQAAAQKVQAVAQACEGGKGGNDVAQICLAAKAATDASSTKGDEEQAGGSTNESTGKGGTTAAQAAAGGASAGIRLRGQHGTYRGSKDTGISYALLDVASVQPAMLDAMEESERKQQDQS